MAAVDAPWLTFALTLTPPPSEHWTEPVQFGPSKGFAPVFAIVKVNSPVFAELPEQEAVLQLPASVSESVEPPPLVATFPEIDPSRFTTPLKVTPLEPQTAVGQKSVVSKTPLKT